MGRVLTRCKLQLEAEIGMFPEREADIDSAICVRPEELTTMNCLCIHGRLYLLKKDLFLSCPFQQWFRFVCHSLQDYSFIKGFYC